MNVSKLLSGTSLVISSKKFTVAYQIVISVGIVKVKPHGSLTGIDR
jgi:hypothetical protein